MKRVTRTFEDTPAVRGSVPMLVGLVGPSGSGKTYSALRLATGMQRVTGGEIFVIDTESRRALHYADDFNFRHLEMLAPFSPLDYLDAIQHCVGKKSGVLVVDTMSAEHEGPGGVLEQHDAELDRLAGDDQGKRQRMTFSAWAKPKAERRKLIGEILRLGISAVFCFRAKEKLKIVPGRNPLHLGWQPIAGDEFIYEMTINCLLYPGSKGVPNWAPDESAEKVMLKLPEHLRGVFKPGEALSEDTGEALAKWAAGDVDPQAPVEPNPELDEAICELQRSVTMGELDAAGKKWSERTWSDVEKGRLREVMVTARELLAEEAQP